MSFKPTNRVPVCHNHPWVTDWPVILTCYISHSAEHRKNADFDPSGSLNPGTKTWNLKHGMVDYIQDPTPHDNFDGSSALWVVWANVWLVTSRSFFSYFHHYYQAVWSVIMMCYDEGNVQSSPVSSLCDFLHDSSSSDRHQSHLSSDRHQSHPSSDRHQSLPSSDRHQSHPSSDHHQSQFAVPVSLYKHFWLMDIVTASSSSSCCFTKRSHIIFHCFTFRTSSLRISSNTQKFRQSFTYI